MTQWSIRYGRVLVAGVLVLAVWELASGGYIYAKARVGQWLIGKAWEQSLGQAQRVKPWFWADTYPIGRLVIPEFGVDQVVLAGAHGRTLAFGPGHHDGSVLPGQPGNAIIVGHRDTHFTFLRMLQPGHVVRFQDRGGRWHEFEVEARTIMDEQKERLVLDGDASTLVLVTCYPFHAIVPGGPLRFVVVARSKTYPESNLRRREKS